MTTSLRRAIPADPWDLAVRIVAMLSLLASIAFGVRYYGYTACQAAWSDKTARSAAARTEAAEADRRAQDRMWQAFADASDPTKVPPGQARQYARDAFNRFLADRAEADRKRAENPAPRPPSEVCR